MVIPFRFHDLRHYSASIMHAIGIPDQYIMARGGWKTDTVLKAVYRNVINDEQKKFTDKINSHFTTMQHEMQHEKEKTPYICHIKNGPEGNRTPVRKPIPCGVSHHSRCFNIPLAIRPSTGLLLQ